MRASKICYEVNQINHLVTLKNKEKVKKFRLKYEEILSLKHFHEANKLFKTALSNSGF